MADGIMIKCDNKTNIINIDPKNKFTNSNIKVIGKNNTIKINYCKHEINKLSIELRGDNNKIIISSSKKVINNLSIQSIRGGNIKVYISEDFGCGGVDIKMNDGFEKLYIGKDALLSWGIKIRTSDAHAVVDLLTDKAINLPLDIYIGDHVWIGEDARLLKGCYIPHNCVVGGFSVVTKKFDEENSIIAGSPAKIVKTNINWDRRRADEVNNNERLIKYKKHTSAIDNIVDINIEGKDISKHWSTIVIVDDVVLKSSSVLTVNYSISNNFEDFSFQILFHTYDKDIYAWSNLQFKNTSGILVVNFDSLKEEGKFDFSNSNYIEIRAKNKFKGEAK